MIKENFRYQVVPRGRFSTFVNQVGTILWSDFCFLRRFWKRTLFTTLMLPLLYLIAFGFGLGSVIEIGGGSYLLFVLPGIIAITAMNTAYNASGNKISIDKLFYKSFDELLMTPIGLTAITVGKALVGVERGVFACTAFIVLGLLFAPGFTVTLPFLLALVLTLLAFSFMGAAVGIYAKTHQDMATFSSLIIMPMSFLGGTLFPVDAMPTAIQACLYALPLTNASVSMRMAVMGDIDPWAFGLSCLYLALFTLIGFIVAQRLLKKVSI